MEKFKPFVDGYYDIANQLPRYLRKQAEAYFEDEIEEKESINTIEAFEKRRDRIQRNFLQAIGGLPRRRESLDPDITSTLDSGAYTVDTLVLESLPNFHVTGNLYRPVEVNEQLPGVLFLCGHLETAKADPEYQKVCIQLVKSGFVVLAIDPIGQGERNQYYNPQTKEITVQGGPIEHTYAGQQCMYAGSNIARYFISDSMYAIDYLASRPDVDEDRLAVTGNSGGGTQTAYLMLTDDRLSAAAPCTYITSRDEYMKTGQAHDAEQNIFRAIKQGLNHDDFVTALAPKPVQIGAVQSDYFCIEGSIQSYERAKAVYGLYNRPENVNLIISAGTHAYTTHLRNTTVAWLCEHLKGDASVAYTGPLEVVEETKLQATEEGQVNAAFAGERNVFDLNAAYIAEHLPDAGIRPQTEDEAAYAVEMRETVVERLSLDKPRRNFYPRFIETERDDEFVYQKVFFKSEPDIVVTGITMKADDFEERKDKTAMIVLLEGGSDEAVERKADVQRIAEEYGLAFAFDPRGVGAVQSRNVNAPYKNGGEYYDYFGTEYKLSCDALMLGTSLFALRVFDVLRAHDFLTNVAKDTDIGVYGEGVGALHALYAAAAEPGFRTVRLAELGPSFHERATTRKFNIDHRLNVYGLIDGCDVSHLLPALSNRDLQIE